MSYCGRVMTPLDSAVSIEANCSSACTFNLGEHMRLQEHDPITTEAISCSRTTYRASLSSWVRFNANRFSWTAAAAAAASFALRCWPRI
eukprot:scaffold619_cov403-Prasinococcus_capsulatus_cf.AAC.8